ncbi:hypothetical protein LZ554_006727 [Drepanopeziza brunnea f. sp. 'monogermtubi']|nr:hypothetical protein LZ554_006727 [Drepanopeziza brunnea f. sp. 'monogermtubi']
MKDRGALPAQIVPGNFLSALEGHPALDLLSVFLTQEHLDILSQHLYRASVPEQLRNTWTLRHDVAEAFANAKLGCVLRRPQDLLIKIANPPYRLGMISPEHFPAKFHLVDRASLSSLLSIWIVFHCPVPFSLAFMNA